MTEGDEKRLAAETIAWLREREENCRRIAKAKVGSDRDGWLEDAAYFNSAITLLARATQAESALAAAREAYSNIREQIIRVRGWEDDSDDDEQSNYSVYTRLLDALDAALTPETP